MILASGGPASDGHTETILPWVSKVRLPQSRTGLASEVAESERPRGPRYRYESVIQVSSWMLLKGFFARNGFCGATERFLIAWALAALPWKAGSEGAGPLEAMGAARAGVAPSANQAVVMQTSRLAISGSNTRSPAKARRAPRL